VVCWLATGHFGRLSAGVRRLAQQRVQLLIGRCGLLPWTLDERPEIEVAYLLAKAYWGQGLGTEAARAVLDYGFEHLHLSRLICLIDRENLASIKVATKIGMTFEKEGRDDKGPFLLYSRDKQFDMGSA
jgi:RimJ/RimL family protein N-acetyltransferase